MAPRTSAGVLLTLSLTLACSPPTREGGAEGGAKKPAGGRADAQVDAKADDPAATKSAPAAPAMGRVLPDAPLALAAVLGHAPDDAEEVLGEASERGSSRISCVRFLPERVFFACEQEARQYPDKTGKFDAIRVEYEDGKAAAVAMTGLVGEGEFSPEKALALAGLELPGEHRVIQPRPEVTVWDYWNSEARLVFDEKQYRVQVSVVDGEWPRSKVEVLLNHPLTDDEKSRIKPAGG